MKKTLKTFIAASLTLGAMAAMPMTAMAQGDQNNISNQNITKLELEQADVRDALKILFQNVGVSYTVAPDVQGPITVNLHNVPFETALQNILKQVDATYRVEGGVFNVIKKEAPPSVPTTGGTEAPPEVTQKNRLQRIKILHADPAIIAMLLAGKVPVSYPPEISAVRSSRNNGGGGGGGRGGFGGGGFGGGGGGFGGGGGGFGGGGMGGFGGGGMGGFGGGGGLGGLGGGGGGGMGGFGGGGGGFGY